MSESEQNQNPVSSLSASKDSMTETVTTQSPVKEPPSQASLVSELQTESSVSNITAEEEDSKGPETSPEGSSEKVETDIPKLLPSSSSISSSQTKKNKPTKSKNSSSTSSTGSQSTNMTKRQRRMLSQHDKTIKVLQKNIKTLTRKLHKLSKTVPRCGK